MQVTTGDELQGGGKTQPVSPDNMGPVRSGGGLGPALAGSLPAHELAEVARALAGNAMYAGLPVESVRRRDQYLFPLNTDYDLFSLGPNGQTASALNNPLSTDDVIRANNGGFFGVASDY